MNSYDSYGFLQSPKDSYGFISIPMIHMDSNKCIRLMIAAIVWLITTLLTINKSKHWRDLLVVILSLCVIKRAIFWTIPQDTVHRTSYPKYRSIEFLKVLAKPEWQVSGCLWFHPGGRDHLTGVLMLRFADVTHHLLQGKASPSIVSEVASASSSYSDAHVYMSGQNRPSPTLVIWNTTHKQTLGTFLIL